MSVREPSQHFVEATHCQPPSGEQVITSTVDNGALFHGLVVQPAFSRAVVLIHLRGLLPSTVHEGGKQEEYNAQVVCRCWLCVSRHNFGTSNNASANSAAQRHDPEGSLGMRPILDQS